MLHFFVLNFPDCLNHDLFTLRNLEETICQDKHPYRPLCMKKHGSAQFQHITYPDGVRLRVSFPLNETNRTFI